MRGSRPALFAVAGLGLLVSACHAYENMVRQRMAADARCPEKEIQIKDLPGGAYQAEGCGKTATYECWWPEGGQRLCTRKGAAPAATLPGTGWR